MTERDAAVRNNAFVETIISADASLNNRDFFGICRSISASQLLTALKELEEFRASTDNLYHQVSSAIIIFAICLDKYSNTILNNLDLFLSFPHSLSFVSLRTDKTSTSILLSVIIGSRMLVLVCGL